MWRHVTHAQGNYDRIEQGIMYPYVICWNHKSELITQMNFQEQDKVTANLFLMSADIAMKACSTFVAFLALVSIKGMPISSANAFTKKNNLFQQRFISLKQKHTSKHRKCLPLLFHKAQPCFQQDRTCFQQGACSHSHLHIGQSHSTIVSRCWSFLGQLHHILSAKIPCQEYIRN